MKCFVQVLYYFGDVLVYSALPVSMTILELILTLIWKCYYLRDCLCIVYFYYILLSMGDIILYNCELTYREYNYMKFCAN